MKYNMTRKTLQYLCINPKFDIHQIRTGALRYMPFEKPEMLQGGLTAYGRLEMYELLPQEHIRSFLYVGWRDFDEEDQKLYDRAMRWGGVTKL